jgi:hypothetical protein
VGKKEHLSQTRTHKTQRKGEMMQSTNHQESTQQRRRSKKMMSNAGSVFMVLVALALSIYMAQQTPPTQGRQQQQQQHASATTIAREVSTDIHTETTSSTNAYTVMDESQPPQVQQPQQTEESDIQVVRSYPSSDYCQHLRVIDNFLYQGRFLQCDNVILGATTLEDKSESLFRVFHQIVAIILASSSSSRHRQQHGGNALLL